MSKPVSSTEQPLPWHIDPEKADEILSKPGYPTTKRVQHRYKDIYHSTPYHKQWRTLPREVLVRLWPPNPTLAVENLSMLFQSLTGPPGTLKAAATEFVNYLTWPKRPENEALVAVAIGLDYVLASNGNSAATITVARTATGFDFERDPRRPVYLRFEKDVAETNVDVPRYPDQPRTDARPWTMDIGILRAARRIQARAAGPPVEIELALESYGSFGDGDLGVGIEIRDETTLDELYREQNRGGDRVE